MFRITTETRSGASRVSVEGVLREEHVDVLLGEVSRLRGEGRTALVDLGGVTWLDRSGTECVRRLLDDGVGCDGVSPFIRTLLGAASPAPSVAQRGDAT